MNLKSEILKSLEACRGEYVSGEKLSQSAGVTRQAVWKTVKKLNEDGYVIHSVTNRGYMLDGKCDLLSSSVISERTGVKVYYYDTVSSTNTVAKSKFYADGACMVVADCQTAGRTKDGSLFVSPERKGIYMSLALPLKRSLSSAENLRRECAETVALCIERACGIKPEIKNTDELYTDGKKICGILIEADVNLATQETRSAVIGIGIYTADAQDTPGYVASSEPRNMLICDIYKSLTKSL